MKLKIKKISTIVLTILAPLVIISGSSGVACAAVGTTCETGNARACLVKLEDEKNSKLLDKILLIIRFMSAAVGVIAVIMLIIGGIQYMTANGNPQSVADAKKKITNVFIGIIAFVFLWAFLEWLVPGGVWS